MQSSWLVHGAPGAIGQVVSGFVSGVVGFSKYLDSITTVFNKCCSFRSNGGYNFGGDIAPVALIIGLHSTFKGQTFAAFQAVWDFISS